MTECQDTTASETVKLCECGCGLPTSIAPQTVRSRGVVKGQPLRFRSSHSAPRAQPREPFIGPLEPGTRMIPLTQGMYAKVDESDFKELSRFVWTAGREGYAARAGRGSELKGNIAMHRQIMQTPDGMVTDHINGDTLDNRRANLRVCTVAENNRNQTAWRPNRYKGVFYIPNGKRKWGARVGVDGRAKYLGAYASEREAALAYDTAARALYGPFARLNFPDL